jgi:hypothetical protein
MKISPMKLLQGWFFSGPTSKISDASPLERVV